MVKIVRYIFLLVATLLWDLQALRAQIWIEQYKAAIENYQEGNISTAYNFSKASFKSYLEEDGNVSKNYAGILHLLSTICYDSSLYDEGIIYAEKEVEVRKQISEIATVDLATALYNLGSLCISASKFDDAEQYFTEALSIYKEYFPPDDENIITCYWKLGTIYLNQKNWSKSCRFFTSGFELYGDPEEVGMDYISACYDMATASAANGEIQNAITYYNKVATIYKTSGYEQTLQNLYVQLHLGDMYKEIHDYTTAIGYYDNVINLHELIAQDNENLLNQALKGKAFSLQAIGRGDEANLIYTKQINDDPSTLNNSAAIAYEEGRLNDAEDLYEKALLLLKADTAALGTEGLEIVLNLINLYLELNELDAAEQHIIEAEKIIKTQQLGDHPLHSSLLVKQAQLSLKHNNYLNSHKFFLKAEKILKTTKGEKSPDYINLLNNMAILNVEQGNYNEAEKLLQQSIAIAEEIDYPRISLINLFNNEAALFQELGKFADARELLERGIDLLQSEKANSVLAGNTYRQKGLLEIQLGNFQQAHQLLASAEKEFADFYGNEHSVMAQHLVDLARLHQAQGKYAEAEKHFILAIQRMERSLGATHPDYLAAVNSYGVLFQTLGNYDEALKKFVLARDGYLKTYGKEHPGYATAVENISTTYQLTGQYEKVGPLLLEAIDIDRKVYGAKHPKYGISLHNLATYYLKQDNYEQSKPLFKEALEIYKNTYGKNHSSYATTLFNLAIANQESGNIKEAESQMKETLAIRNNILGKDHSDYSFTLFGLAQLNHKIGAMEKASLYYKEGVKRYLHQIDQYFPALSEKEKSAFYIKIKPAFYSYADFAISYYESTGNTEVIKDLYDLQLATKAILLNASNKVRERILNSNDKELKAKYQRWTYLKEQLIKAVGLTPVEQQKLNLVPADLEDSLNLLEKELSEGSSLFSETYEKEKVTWHEVQAGLQKGEAAIEIMRINKRFISDSVFYAALIIKPSADPVAVILPGGKELEQRYFNYYRNAIKFNELDVVSYNKFWAPIEEYLSDTEKCFVSTDGIYNKISLTTLYDPSLGKYLLEQLNIRLVSNTKEVADEVKAVSDGKYAVVFGVPDFSSVDPGDFLEPTRDLTSLLGDIPELPGTKEEVENLRNILSLKNWKSEIYLEQNATEENFKNVRNPSILHVATHGFFMSDISDNNEDIGIHLNNEEYNPLFRSGLLLTGAARGMDFNAATDGEDGILTAYEAMNLHLDQTEIVILSACETGLGKIRNGEGVYGLQRALIVAGAKSVIMSLWKVDDNTTMELMTAFYNRLLEGEDKFSAFKAAQLEIKNKYQNPYHWGAFVMLGN